MAPVSLAQAFRYWLKLGFISFGGPAGQISIMHQELVEKRRWISEQRFLHALNFCMVLPGPEAQQLATYIGWLQFGLKGGIMAGGLFVLPSLILLIALSWIYLVWGRLPLIAGLLYGIKPAVTAIVLFAAWRIGKRALKHPYLQTIAALSFMAIALLKLPFPLILLLAAVLGWLGMRLFPAAFVPSSRSGREAQRYGPSLIDDDTPVPEHARYSHVRLLQTIAIGLGLWLLAMVLLGLVAGWHHGLTQMGWFFTKAALLTFGGAYAVLPYVVQGGVQTFGWLSTPQMMDGLALGETTPGPLIMVVTFVAFVGGWNGALFGPDRLALAGIVAACVVTFFTFLPSFLFILIGGPLVEASRQELHLTAPLTGITAAVVGVILNLALFFGRHLLFPDGTYSSLDPFALILMAVALMLLVRFQWNLIRLISLCAALGWLYQSVCLLAGQ